MRGGVQGSPTHARGLARHPGSESLPVETMTDGEDTSRHTIDTILEVLEGSASLESALPSGGDDGTVWWSVLVPGPGGLVSDPVVFYVVGSTEWCRILYTRADYVITPPACATPRGVDTTFGIHSLTDVGGGCR